MTVNGKEVKVPTPSASSEPALSPSKGQALSQKKPREGWGSRTVPPFDPEYTPGARNAVSVCLRVQPAEKVCVITDEATMEIAASMTHELETLGSPYNAWVLEDLAARPLQNLPSEIVDDLETSQVSIFAVWAQRNELRSRMQMTDVVNRRKIRHAHMVNINRQIMLEGMRADFQKVDRLSAKVVAMVRKARRVRAKTAAGTDLTADLNPNYRWLKTSGIITPEKWGNLPGGEIFTTPGEVNGTFVIDGVVGDYLCTKFGSLQGTPLTVHIKQNRLTEAHSENRELEDDFWKYTHTDENSDRVGEFAIGTNIDLKDVIGQILQDEKYPGVHIAFGNPYGAHTGADWDSSTHIDVVGRKFDIWVDDEQIMQGGKFLVEA
jgi:leucyl aminopeptidase (aminopeptidase T)